MKKSELQIGRIAGGREQKFDSPYSALACAGIVYAISDYAKLGVRRHRQRCKTGRDWLRDNPKKKASKNFVPKVYRELQERVEWIYSDQFAVWCDEFNIDLDKARELFLRLLAGPPNQKQCPRCKDHGDIEKMFGYRKSRGKLIQQSYCRTCRNKGKK